MSEENNLLMIVYHFPSVRAVRRRSYFAYQEFKKYFNNVKIISTTNRKYAEEQYNIQADDIYSAITFDYHNIRGFSDKSNKSNSNFKTGKLPLIITKLIDSFPFNLIIGEGGLIYIMAAFFIAVRLIKKNKITHLFSSFRPYSDHFVAFLIKCFYPRIFWIADFRDLHLDSIQNNLIFVPLQKWFNKTILKKANVITTVSFGLEAHLSKYHKNTYVLRNGIGGDIKVNDKLSFNYTKFTITYTGSLSRSKKDLNQFFEAVSNLLIENKIHANHFQIIHAGTDFDIWINKINEYKLFDIIKHEGIIKFRNSLSLQQQTHINLLLTFSSHELTGILTGKLYEYLAAGKPILSIVKGTRDKELESIIRNTNSGIVVYDNERDTGLIKDFILKYYLEWHLTGNVQNTIQPYSLKKYKWSNMMKKFLYNKVLTSKLNKKHILFDK